jgi:cytochrome P450
VSSAALRRYPIVGHTPAFLADRLAFLDAAAKGAERAVELRIGRRTFLLVDASEVRHVLVTNARNYEKTPRLTSRQGRRVSGAGVLTAAGAAHREQRRLLQPDFTQRAVAPYAAEMVATAEEQVRRWQPGQVVDVTEEMVTIARRIIMRVLLGRLPSADEERLEEAIVWRRRHIEHVFHSFLPAPDRVPTRINRIYRRHRPFFRDLTDRYLETLGEGGRNGSLLGALAEAQAAAGGLDENRLLDEAITILVTGHETVGDALGWAWHLLGKHPEVEGRVRAELAEHLGDKDPDESATSALPYSWHVLSETMRLYPPTWLFVRIAQEDDALPTGVRVPAGSKVYLSQWVIHRSPRYYRDPESFDPDRFAPEISRERPRHSYFPFGFGPRVCIGEALARLELLVVLSVVAQRFRLVPEPGLPAEPDPGITLRPRHGIRMRVEPAAASDRPGD